MPRGANRRNNQRVAPEAVDRGPLASIHSDRGAVCSVVCEASRQFGVACEWRAGAGRAGQLAEFWCSGCRSGGGGGRCCQARRRPRRLRRVRELQPCRQRTQSPRSTDINPDTYNTFTTSEAARRRPPLAWGWHPRLRAGAASRLGGRLCRHGRSRIRQRASTRLNPWLDDVPVLPTPPKSSARAYG